MCAQWRLRSAWASTQSSLGAQSFCWFCHEAAQVYYLVLEKQRHWSDGTDEQAKLYRSFLHTAYTNFWWLSSFAFFQDDQEPKDAKFSPDGGYIPRILFMGKPFYHFSFGPRQANLVLIACASSEGSGEPAHPRSLARTFAARPYKQWVKRNFRQKARSLAPLNGDLEK